MKQQLMAATASFAHLLGRPVAAKRAAEEDGDDKKKDDDEAAASAVRAEDEPEQGDDESDDDFKKRHDKWKDDQGDDDDDEGDAKGSDESDSDDMRKRGPASARLRERARCAAIFADAAAGKNPPLAATLAFNTDLPRSQAIKVLRAGGLAVVPEAVRVTPRQRLDERMAANRIPAVAAGDTDQNNRTDRPPGYDMATQIIVAGMRRDAKPDEEIQRFVARRNAA